MIPVGGLGVDLLFDALVEINGLNLEYLIRQLATNKQISPQLLGGGAIVETIKRTCIDTHNKDLQTVRHSDEGV